MPAPTDATYLLQSANTDLPGSRTLVGDSSLGIHLNDGGPEGNMTIQTAGQLKTLAQANTSGLYILNTSTDTFVRQGLNSNGTISLVNAGFVLDSDPTTPANPVLAVVPGSHVQKINVALNGTIDSTQPTINFKNGAGITIGVVNNGGTNSADVTITNSGSSGTVTSVTLSTSTGMFLVGQDETTDVQWAVDLPPGGAEGDVLTVTTAGDPQVVGWVAPDSASGWSNFPAIHDIVMQGFAVSWGPEFNTTTLGAYITDTLAYPQFTYSSTETAIGYPVITESVPGETYGTLGNLLYGLGQGGPGTVPCYGDLAAPTIAGTYALQINDVNQTPYWAASVTSDQSATVILQNSPIVIAGRSDYTPLGNGIFWVTDPNITATSVVMVTGSCLFNTISDPPGTPNTENLETNPGDGPFQVFLNYVDGGPTGLPVGFCIVGRGGGDTGKQVSYSIVKYS